MDQEQFANALSALVKTGIIWDLIKAAENYPESAAGILDIEDLHRRAEKVVNDLLSSLKWRKAKFSQEEIEAMIKIVEPKLYLRFHPEDTGKIRNALRRMSPDTFEVSDLLAEGEITLEEAGQRMADLDRQRLVEEKTLRKLGLPEILGQSDPKEG